MISKIAKACNDLKEGKTILIFDDENREGETDLIIPAQFVTPDHIKLMRKDGGGLIVLMVSNEIAKFFKLPYLEEIYKFLGFSFPLFEEIYPSDLPYDGRTSFSISINHRDTFTGITDRDRALTIRRFAELAGRIANIKEGVKAFGKEFRSPGHVPICIARERLLNERKGHTELSVALLKIAGLTPVACGCEMMGEDGRALSKEEAEAYARKKGYVFLEGSEIEEEWRKWLE